MSAALVQMVLVIGLTQAFRALVTRLGPRRGGLLLGLPTTTAILLVCAGMERGVIDATGTAEACLLGLVAAVALPLVYAEMMVRGWGLPWTPVFAVAGWLGVITLVRCAPTGGTSGAILVAGLGVVLACRLACKLQPSEGPNRPGKSSFPFALSSRWLTVSRSAVPAVSYLAARGLRTVAGPSWSGHFMTFPGASLAVLVSTHLEAGPGVAHRVAVGMPSGGLGMLAFLAVFRFGCPWLGLGWGTALGYVSAIGTLIAVDVVGRRMEGRLTESKHAPKGDALPPSRSPRRRESLRTTAVRFDPTGPRGSPRVKARQCRGGTRRARFSPRIEMLAG
jgi:hypothetical protein